MPRFGSPRPFSRSSLVQAQGRGSLRLLSSQEEDFIRPSSREEAQQLWEAEKVKMRQVLDRQQKQMVEDSQWLRREERCLVSGRPLFPYPGRGMLPKAFSILSTLEPKSSALVFSAGPYGLYE